MVITQLSTGNADRSPLSTALVHHERCFSCRTKLSRNFNQIHIISHFTLHRLPLSQTFEVLALFCCHAQKLTSSSVHISRLHKIQPTTFCTQNNLSSPTQHSLLHIKPPCTTVHLPRNKQSLQLHFVEDLVNVTDLRAEFLSS